MWTILVNYDEYAVGIYETEQEAERIVVKYIRGDEPDLDESSDQELLDSNDGYYRVLEIKGVRGYEIQSKGNRNMVCRCKCET